jgi:hypothetical protein
MAEDAARELPNPPLEDALKLVHPYAERGSPKYEKAAMRWLERYLTASAPKLRTPRRSPRVWLRRRRRDLGPSSAAHQSFAFDQRP